MRSVRQITLKSTAQYARSSDFPFAFLLSFPIPRAVRSAPPPCAERRSLLAATRQLQILLPHPIRRPRFPLLIHQPAIAPGHEQFRREAFDAFPERIVIAVDEADDELEVVRLGRGQELAVI